MHDELVRYVIGGGFGLSVALVAIPVFGIPSAFVPFAARTIAIMLGASLLGIWLFDRYLDWRH